MKVVCVILLITYILSKIQLPTSCLPKSLQDYNINIIIVIHFMRSPTGNSPADILKSSPLVLAFSAVVLSKMSSLCICIFYPNETENFPLPLLSSSTCFGLNILSLLDRPKRGSVNSNLESSKFMLLLLFSAWKMAKNLRLARVCERMYCGISNYIV